MVRGKDDIRYSYYSAAGSRAREWKRLAEKKPLLDARMATLKTKKKDTKRGLCQGESYPSFDDIGTRKW